MKNYIPDAAFDLNDEPIGDKRWFHQELYRRNRWAYAGPKPDRYSPHTRTEEAEIQEAIITGNLKPRNEPEQVHRRQIDFPRPRSDWPKKWVTCIRCGGDWTALGYPIGRQSKWRDRYTTAITAHVLKDESGIVWMFPKYCEFCVDILTAKPANPEKKPAAKKNVRQPNADA